MIDDDVHDDDGNTPPGGRTVARDLRRIVKMTLTFISHSFIM
jgi:hypothetical protein